MKLDINFPMISSLSSAQECDRDSAKLTLAALSSLPDGSALYFDRKQVNKSHGVNTLYFRVFCIKRGQLSFLTQAIITAFAIESYATLGDKTPLLVVHREDELQAIVTEINRLTGKELEYITI